MSPAPAAGAIQYTTKLFVAPPIGANEVRVIATDESTDRAGDIVKAAGCDYADFMKNPVVLFAHDPSQPVAKVSKLEVLGSRVEATISFPPAGTSNLSDEVRALVKAGVLSAVSIGFQPLKWQPVTPGKGGAGVIYTKWELLEISFVSIPANANALVVQRAARRKAGRVLSAANEGTLRAAHDAAETARALVAAVISQVAGDEQPEGADAKALARKDDGTLDDDALPQGTCGLSSDVECGMSDPEECSVHASPMGDCGRAAAAACGLKDAKKCLTHAPLENEKAMRRRKAKALQLLHRPLVEIEATSAKTDGFVRNAKLTPEQRRRRALDLQRGARTDTRERT